MQPAKEVLMNIRNNPNRVTRTTRILCTLAFAMLMAVAGAASAVTLTVSLNGSGSVTSSPSGISCNILVPNCSADFPAGTTVTLIPSPGSAISAWSGACSGAGACTVTLNGAQSVGANFAANCPFTVESGWWWDTAQGGRGYFIDNQAGSVYFAALEFSASGGETWYVASGFIAAAGNTCTFSGSLTSYAGGQTLTGAYRAPTSSTVAGNLSMSFSDAAHASASFPGETIPLTRYVYASSGIGNGEGAGDAHTGVWWSPTEGGRGYLIEIQNGVLYMGAYMYDAGGLPVWYVTGPGQVSAAPCCANLTPSVPASYSGQWVQYGNGQTLGGPYKAPTVVNASAGAVTLQFSSNPQAATLTLPDGRQIPVVRYRQ
jgi:hypothetical protein